MSNKIEYITKYNKQIRFTHGNGGSNAIMFFYKGYFYKVFISKTNEPKNFELDEITILKELTKNIYDKKLTPHFAPWVDNYKLDLVKFLKSNKRYYCKNGDDIKMSRFTDLTNDVNTENFCKLGITINNQFYKKNGDVLIQKKVGEDTLINLFVELCYNDFPKMMKHKMFDYKNLVFPEILKPIFFQILFTLTVIHNKYPSFCHNDLHFQNILWKGISKGNKFTKYIFKNKEFVMDRNIIDVYLIDFGHSNMLNIRSYKDNPMFTSNCKKCDFMYLIFEIVEVLRSEFLKLLKEDLSDEEISSDLQNNEFFIYKNYRNKYNEFKKYEKYERTFTKIMKSFISYLNNLFGLNLSFDKFINTWNVHGNLYFNRFINDSENVKKMFGKTPEEIITSNCKLTKLFDISNFSDVKITETFGL